MRRKFGIGWQVGGTTGWGVYGRALMLHGAARGLLPVPVYVSQHLAPNPLEERLIAPIKRQWFIEQELLALNDGANTRAEYPFLMGLGNDLTPPDFLVHIEGTPDIGVVFFEHRSIPADAVATAKARFATIVAGSTWNAEVLADLGFPNVAFCPQGIDLTRFHPAPKSSLLADRFVVFSGGKLEFRKGQDIVVEAFRRFHARHPEALLMLAWHNHWDLSVSSLKLSPHRLGVPQRASENGPWKMAEWLRGLGLPADAVIDLGEVANAQMPGLLRECDVGVFPNRCEGGTNLVAMECMACGVPAVLSANTGHRDLLARSGASLPLTRQTTVAGGSKNDPSLFLDWGESDPEEIVERLEWVFAHRKEAQAIGAAGAAFMQEWSWPRKLDVLFQSLGMV